MEPKTDAKKKNKFVQAVKKIPFIPVLIAVVIIVVFILSRDTGKAPADTMTLPEGWMIIKPPVQTTIILEWRDAIYVGDSKGVYIIDRETGEVQEKLGQSVSMEYVRMMLVSDDDRLWVCHVKGLSVFDGAEWINYTKNDGLPSNRVNCVIQRKDGKMMAGTDAGAATLEGGSWDPITIDDGLLENPVNMMLEHENGSIFFGSNISPRGGISCFYDGRWQYFTTDNGLPHNHIVVLYEDRRGSLWAGTGYMWQGGACRFEFGDGEWKIAQILLKEDGLAGEKVCAIYEQKNGVMWFGSEYDGIAFGKDGKWKTISVEDGLAGPEVKSVLEDSRGNFWMGTPSGVSRLTPEALKTLLESIK